MSFHTYPELQSKLNNPVLAEHLSYEKPSVGDEQDLHIQNLQKQTQQAMTAIGLQLLTDKLDYSGKKIAFLTHSAALDEQLESGALDNFFKDLSRVYRTIYADKPWDEFLSCQSDSCNGTIGINQAYSPYQLQNFTVEMLENICLDDYECPSCQGPVEYFYHPENHINTLKESFKKKFFMTLLYSPQNTILGFCLGFQTTIAEGWQDKVIVGNGDQSRVNLSYQDYLQEAINLFGGSFTPQDTVINVAEWGVKRSAQSNGLALMLMKALYEQSLKRLQSTSEEDIPVFAHSLDGSRAFKVTSKMGFRLGKKLESGERRAYLTLKKAIEGIENMMSEYRIGINPIPLERLDTLPPRDTLVIEMLCHEAVGTTEISRRRVQTYLYQVAQRLGLEPLCEAVTHLSPLYGLSGWLPLSNGSAIHLYAWDYKDGSFPPFISIDISTPGIIENTSVFEKHAQHFFGTLGNISTKTLQPSHHQNWVEFAPQIHRQRISISGNSERPITKEKVKAYLIDLAPALNMVQLSLPLVSENSAWIHWETSGVVLTWQKNTFSVDIYTCKAFDDDYAKKFTADYFHLTDLKSKSF